MERCPRHVKSGALDTVACSRVWQHVLVTEMTAPRTARARARAELTQEIVDTARAHLALEGAAGLSLRAVARDLGMVSSAIYRYFPSRDDLLTRLIIDAYNSLGEAAEVAEAQVRRSDLRGRWLAVAHGVRTWGLAHPHEWGLLYGTPVPGYAAPQDTVDPANRVTGLLIALLAEMPATSVSSPISVPKAARASLSLVRATIPETVSDDLIFRGLMAWTQLIGTVTLDVNGQYHNVISGIDDYFDHAMRRVAASLDLG
jgi:AcrR family transcriptional regulator